MLARALKMAFWVCYDHLGKLLLVNLASFLLCALPLTAGSAVAPHLPGVGYPGSLLAACAATVMVCFSCSAAMAWMARGLIETRDGTVGAFFSGLRRFGLRGAVLGFVYAFMAACLASSVWFYAAHLGGTHPVAGYGLSAVAFWAAVLLLLTIPAAVPAMVFKELGPVGAMRFSVLLVAGNPLYFAGLAAWSALIVFVSVAVPPVLLCFGLAALVVLHCSAYEMLSRKYAAIEAARASGGPVRLDFDDANDDYLNRGIRDILFPWKG